MDKTIIKEYLHHFYTYEELASYLSISVDEVKRVLNDSDLINNILGPNGYNRITTHQEHINKWLKKNGNDLLKVYDDKDKRVVEVANYIIDTNASLGKVATHFKIGKTTVHDYIEEKLPIISITLYKKVFDVKNGNMSLSSDYIDHQTEISNEYALLMNGYSIDEIATKLNINRNKVQRDLNNRLNNIDEDKASLAHKVLGHNRTYGKRK